MEEFWSSLGPVVDCDIQLVGNFISSILFDLPPLGVLQGQVGVVGGAAVEVVREPGAVYAVPADHAVGFGVHCHVGARHLQIYKEQSISTSLKITISTMLQTMKK